MFITFLLFFIGFFILIKGANLLVKGASDVARFLGVSNWVIGLTIVGIGTSIPEFSISFLANLQQVSNISWGAIIGSNIFNILFIGGIAALIFPLALQREWVRRDLPINFLAVIIVWFFAAFNPFNANHPIGITRLEGAILSALLVLWLYYVIKKTPPDKNRHKDNAVFTVPTIAFMIFAGFVGVILGGKWVVDGAMAMAELLSISETLIGLTVVSIGTSLPELVVSAVAASRKNPGIAMGNIVGSNVFDFLGIIGLSALAQPVVFFSGLNFDFFVLLLAAILIIVFALVGRKYVISRTEGALLIIIYLAYLIYLIFRG